jgi:hypothetical protein
VMYQISEGSFYYERRGVGGVVTDRVRKSKKEVEVQMKEIIERELESARETQARSNDAPPE